MIRTAGGRAVDGIKSLAVLQTISGAGIVVVMHHTGQWSSLSWEIHLCVSGRLKNMCDSVSFLTTCRLRRDAFPQQSDPRGLDEDRTG
jgi:hypothetical protein